MIKKIMCMLIAILFLLIVFSFVLNNNSTETYNVGSGAGRVFSIHKNPAPICNAENNCFPGYYLRSQIYQNMCEPLDYKEGGLLRDKIQSVDGCTRQLGSNLPKLRKNIVCKIDRNNQRHCYIRR